MKLVDYSVKDRIGYITLNRPEKRNALSFELVEELINSFSKAEADSAAKVIVLRANGNVFCSGADLGNLEKLQNFSKADNLKDSLHLRDLFYKIYTSNKVVIAQVQGHAIAGGCGLATVCDFVYAVSEAKFGYTEVKIGFVPAIVMVFLIRKIGEQKSKHLLLSGELVSGEAARQVGLVNCVVEKDRLEAAVMEFANKLIKNNSGHSMGLTKRMIGDVQSMKLEAALAYAVEMNVEARTSEDCKKGIRAFLNKEDLIW
ncbi:MAG: enoyl-CoA hydratase/isomerase family protein [Bacteroidia bacterium]|nr:enoyl-CoA hydratase/isomerase family protein [Bacteroidia bacterium]